MWIPFHYTTTTIRAVFCCAHYCRAFSYPPLRLSHRTNFFIEMQQFRRKRDISRSYPLLTRYYHGSLAVAEFALMYDAPLGFAHPSWPRGLELERTDTFAASVAALPPTAAATALLQARVAVAAVALLTLDLPLLIVRHLGDTDRLCALLGAPAIPLFADVRTLWLPLALAVRKGAARVAAAIMDLMARCSASSSAAVEAHAQVLRDMPLPSFPARPSPSKGLATFTPGWLLDEMASLAETGSGPGMNLIETLLGHQAAYNTPSALARLNYADHWRGSAEQLGWDALLTVSNAAAAGTFTGTDRMESLLTGGGGGGAVVMRTGGQPGPAASSLLMSPDLSFGDFPSCALMIHSLARVTYATLLNTPPSSAPLRLEFPFKYSDSSMVFSHEEVVTAYLRVFGMCEPASSVSAGSGATPSAWATALTLRPASSIFPRETVMAHLLAALAPIIRLHGRAQLSAAWEAALLRILEVVYEPRLPPPCNTRGGGTGASAVVDVWSSVPAMQLPNRLRLALPLTLDKPIAVLQSDSCCAASSSGGGAGGRRAAASSLASDSSNSSSSSSTAVGAAGRPLPLTGVGDFVPSWNLAIPLSPSLTLATYAATTDLSVIARVIEACGKAVTGSPVGVAAWLAASSSISGSYKAAALPQLMECLANTNLLTDSYGGTLLDVPAMTAVLAQEYVIEHAGGKAGSGPVAPFDAQALYTSIKAAIEAILGASATQEAMRTSVQAAVLADPAFFNEKQLKTGVSKSVVAFAGQVR